MRASSLSFALAAALIASDCAPRNQSGDPAARSRAGVVVVRGQQLHARGRLLDALAGRVSNMRVHRVRGQCPVILLRGPRTIVGSPNPNVYVDGTLMGDTCVLDEIQVNAIDRIEIYPSGISPPAGYTPAANGVILVFLTGEADPATGGADPPRGVAARPRHA